MKKVIALFTLVFVLINFSFSQVNPIKDFPLKDYVAPEIKYRSFDLNTYLGSNGFNTVSENDSYGSSMNATLRYYEYINMKKHQGISSGSFYTNFNFTNSKYDTLEGSSKAMSFDINYGTQNRFYKKNKVFIGVHGNLQYRIDPFNDETGKNNYKRQSQRFTVTPYISLGKGRIEPVESARRAMEILISQEKCNRLALMPDSSQIDSLARVANRIRYKRYFDNRFKTIYQLEELNKAIQNLGIVDTHDIVYFANLNDIWNYAPNFKRGSGTRFEGGLIPDLNFHYSKFEDQDEPQNSKSKSNSYGIYGFFSFSRMRPISYAWQSSLMIDFTLGYNEHQSNYEYDEGSGENKWSSLKGLLNAGWQFGFFPNTRTNAGITPFIGISFYRDLERSENTFGVSSGFRFDMYYYVSPRLRLTFDASFNYTENFDFSVPSPFWNSLYPNYYGNTSSTYTDNQVAFPVDSFTSVSKKILYSAFIGLSYAIF